MRDMSNGYHGDFETWYLDSSIENKIFRMSVKGQESLTDDYVFMSQVVPMPDGRIYVGFQELDEDFPDSRFPGYRWYYLDEVNLSMFESDQFSSIYDEEEENEDEDL